MGAILGEAARVIVTPQTMELAHKPLSFKRRQELRKEAIIAYIKSKPYGKRIMATEFAEVANFKSGGGAWLFVSKLVDQGIIYRNELGPRSFSYSVPESEVKILREAKPTKLKLTVSEIKEKAMQFSWDNEEYANDLRKFIASLEKL